MKEKKTITKKIKALLLAVAMIVTSFPAFSTTVHATELPDSTQFAMKEDLMKFDTDDTNGEDPVKVYFGNNNQQWWIVGSQNNDSIVLFAASSLGNQPFSSDSSNKQYAEAWNCTYPAGTTITEVNPDHYGASTLRNTLQGLENSHFTSDERKLMKDTTVYTSDTKNNNSVYATTDKLYIPYGEGGDYITAGANDSDSLNNGLHIDKTYWGWGNSFWLRRGHGWSVGYCFATFVFYDNDPHSGENQRISTTFVTDYYPIRPAFELDISTVLFGSTVPAISSDGQQNINDAFTLRYKSDNLGSAEVSFDKSKVNLSSVTRGTYLVAQNNEGAYAKEITNETTVSASDMGLSGFDNCKVWLETTDSDQRMTYATLATEEQGSTVNITLAEGMEATSGGLTQKIGENKPIENIVIKAKDDYFFPADYVVEGQSGITVARDSENQITVSGTPTADVSITLPPATAKSYNMALSGSGTFTRTCVGYDPVTANEFTITNTGNVDLKNVSVSITGDNADKFDLNKDTATTIQPNGTIKVTVKPQDSLAIGTYQATLTVSADNATDVTTNLQFTVSEHDYEAVVTPPSCTQKGYTTYTCKNCNGSYTGDETDVIDHTWGEWKVIKEATTTTTGEKERICEHCGTKETEVIPVISNEDTNKPNTEKPNTEKPNNDKSNGSVETGDQTNIGLYLSLLAISGLFIAILAVLRKKKTLANREM